MDKESEKLLDDYRRAAEAQKEGCRLCKDLGCPEFLELQDCITGKLDIERMYYCPRCGRKLEG